MARPGRPNKNPLKDTAKIITKRMNEKGRDIGQGQVEGLIRDMALSHTELGVNYSQNKLAERYRVAFGDVSSVRNMCRASLPDIREQMLVKASIIADKASSEVMDRLHDPEQLAEIKTADLARIAKMSQDAMRDLSSAGGNQTVQVFNIGDVAALKEAAAKLADRPSLEDKLREAGQLNVIEENAEG